MSNVETAYEFFVNNGFTPAQASGIVGNLQQESGVNPESIQPGGAGRGIAQWSQGGRWLSGLMTGNVQKDLQNQEQYILDELQANPAYGLAALKATSTPTQAAQVFGSNFEKYGIEGNRVADAQNIYNQSRQGNWPSAGAGTASASATLGLTGTGAMLTSGNIQPPNPNGSTPGGIAGDQGVFNDVGGVFGGVLGDIVPGFSAVGSVVSDVGAIATEAAAALGLASQQQSQGLQTSGFLQSVDELLNPTVSLFAPWKAITMLMGRTVVGLLGMSVLLAGVAVILFGTKAGRDLVGAAVKTVEVAG